MLQQTPWLLQQANGMNGFKYRVQLNKIGNSCGLNSNETTLTVYPLPVVNDVTIIQWWWFKRHYIL
jgi:hypothetical protein